MLAYEFAWLIAALPLLAFVLIIFFLSPNRLFTAITSIGAVGIGFLYSVFILIYFLASGSQGYEINFRWLEIGNFHFDIGLQIDPLTITMLLVVTSVSLLVQIFTHGYMHDDKGYSKFYAMLSLFTAAMLGLVFSTNLFELYIFWELVGLCSFLLIGFWHDRPSAADASFKAFVINRIGDCGLLLGILLFATITFDLWGEGAFLGFSSLSGVLSNLTQSSAIETTGFFSLTVIAILMLLGPMAKSAQFPLHTWLPDAMEGPTPISALIHAATMVAAGVFLLARLFPIYQLSSIASSVVMVVGAVTAIFAATIALSQNDIKKVLADSTCSQLGYMVMSIGAAESYVPAIFHLVTHAFFKAMLFLGSGSVIHGCHHEQDIRQYGGLASKMPFTHATFLIGTMAISGVPLLSGFWSKDLIILSTWQLGAFNSIYLISVITAGLTAFYMFRLYFLTFQGNYRGHAHPHESPPSIVVPLLVLAVPSVLIGLIGTELAPLGGDLFGRFLLGSEHFHHSISFTEFLSELLSLQSLIPLLLSLGGVLLAYLTYQADKLKLNQFFKSTPFYQLSLNKWFVDEFYAFIVQGVFLKAFRGFWWLVDRLIIDTVLIGSSIQISKISGWAISRLQSGQTQTYIGIMLLALVAIILIFFSLLFQLSLSMTGGA
ncbi:MAG: NADH-quinone oxidoreductase subunit L [Candidatus Caenarcaniphilales bacterium]|nr:NADH-quinone oxidoreductase subunit L [Candidatus Caenarcaniphilales bacterium]